MALLVDPAQLIPLIIVVIFGEAVSKVFPRGKFT
jgi:hypothetical protein